MGKIIVPEAPRIWTRRPKIMEPRDPITFGITMAGEFRLRVMRPDGRCRIDTGFFPNLITNLGLNRPGAGTNYGAISVGTGNATPLVTDTNLQARIATTATDQGSGYTASVGTPGDVDWYTAYTLTLRFAQGAAAGNLTEIGVTTNATPWPCYSRALILDGGGSPTTLTVLSDEFLDATYRHRWYAGAGVINDVPSTISISGTDYDIVLRRAEVDGGGNAWRPDWNWTSIINAFGQTAYNGAIGAITATPSGTASSDSSRSNASYVTDTFVRGHTCVWGLNNGNLAGGISAFQAQVGGGRVPPGSGGSSSASYQFSVDPPIPKTSAQILTMNYQSSWARRSI